MFQNSNLYSGCFNESNISIILSRSASSLNGILILPFPLLLHDNCTFAPKKLERWFCRTPNVSGSFSFFTVFFSCFSAFSDFTSSSTFLTEYQLAIISLNIFNCICGSSIERRARACPISISLFFNATWIVAGSFRSLR